MSYSDDERNSVRSSSPVPRGLFSDHSGDEDEEDRRSRRSGGSPAREREMNSDEEEEEERKQQEAKRKKDEEKKKKQKAKGPVKRMQIHEDMLIGRKGVSTIPEIFKDFKFGGKGRERDDLGKILSKLEHWIHLLHPKQPFDQSLQRIEFLGLKRKVVKTHLKKIRMGMLSEEITTDDVVQDNDDDADVEFPNFEGSEMEQEEIRRAMNHQVPGASASTPATVQSSSGLQNDDDGFPNDDDILDAMNGGFTPVTTNTTAATKVNAQASYQEHEDDFDDDDMDVVMGDEPVDLFSKEMELALKRAEMAETQQQVEKPKEKEFIQLSASNSTIIDSSSVTNAIAKAFEIPVEDSSTLDALSATDSESIPVSEASASLPDTPTVSDSAVVANPPPPSHSSPSSTELTNETPEVQSDEKNDTEENNGISLDDLEDADDDDME